MIKVKIRLFGEIHNISSITNEEIRLFVQSYTEDDLRHLFLEMPYYYSQIINQWLENNDNSKINKLFNELILNKEMIEFLEIIRYYYSDTIIHGTDIGHPLDKVGYKYLKYLEDLHKKETIEYSNVLKCINQGETYYSIEDPEYRELCLTNNFIQEFELLEDKNIFGIYGSAHIRLNQSNSIKSMASRLLDKYKHSIHIVDLSHLAFLKEPLDLHAFQIGERKYLASYFGTIKMEESDLYVNAEYWRIEDAYKDFQKAPYDGNLLPKLEYPMIVEEKEVYVVKFQLKNKKIETYYFKSDESTNIDGMTNGFRID